MDIARLVELNATYARVIDNEQFEEWPRLFHDPCLYKLTTAENVARGFEGGLIYADTRGMLEDRISSLRKVNIYERQRYRHIVGLPVVLGQADGTAEVETPFLIVRIMRDGTMDVFATGCYRDKVKPDASGALRFEERIVVCDGRRFDTLVAIPFDSTALDWRSPSGVPMLAENATFAARQTRATRRRDMHSIDFKLQTPISPHLVKEVAAKLAYLDEEVQSARISTDGSTITLSTPSMPTPEMRAVLSRRIDGLIEGMSNGRLEPILKTVEAVEYRHVGTEDPLPELLEAREVIAEGPGFFALGPKLSGLIALFEGELLAIANQARALPFRFPALIAPAYLERVQYFRNFPHSLSFATHLRESLPHIERFSSEAKTENGRISVVDGLYARAPAMLSPTVCHHLYNALAGRKVPTGGLAATACGHCFRYESSNMIGLERLWDFTMREVIFVGSEDYVRNSLSDLREKVRGMLEIFQISHNLMTANDPFFIGTFRDQAAYQAAFEMKHEVRAALPFKQDTVAIGSYNRHGDFFGRSLDIQLPDGEPVNTGCFGIGFERMAFAFVAQHTTNIDNWPEAVRAGWMRAAPSVPGMNVGEHP